jgi:hypothetical protein
MSGSAPALLAFKTEFDDDARQALFPQNARLVS